MTTNEMAGRVVIAVQVKGKKCYVTPKYLVFTDNIRGAKTYAPSSAKAAIKSFLKDEDNSPLELEIFKSATIENLP